MITQPTKWSDKYTHGVWWGPREDGWEENWIEGRGEAYQVKDGMWAEVFFTSKYPHIFLTFLCGTPLRSALDIPSNGFSSARWPASLQAPDKSPLSHAAVLNLGCPGLRALQSPETSAFLNWLGFTGTYYRKLPKQNICSTPPTSGFHFWIPFSVLPISHIFLNHRIYRILHSAFSNQ